MEREKLVSGEKVKKGFVGLEYGWDRVMKVYWERGDEMEKEYKGGMKCLSR